MWTNCISQFRFSLKPTYIVGGTENSRQLDTSIRNTTEKGARRKKPRRDPRRIKWKKEDTLNDQMSQGKG